MLVGIGGGMAGDPSAVLRFKAMKDERDQKMMGTILDGILKIGKLRGPQRKMAAKVYMDSYKQMFGRDIDQNVAQFIMGADEEASANLNAMITDSVKGGEINLDILQRLLGGDPATVMQFAGKIETYGAQVRQRKQKAAQTGAIQSVFGAEQRPQPRTAADARATLQEQINKLNIAQVPVERIKPLQARLKRLEEADPLLSFQNKLREHKTDISAVEAVMGRQMGRGELTNFLKVQTPKDPTKEILKQYRASMSAFEQITGNKLNEAQKNTLVRRLTKVDKSEYETQAERIAARIRVYEEVTKEKATQEVVRHILINDPWGIYGAIGGTDITLPGDKPKPEAAPKNAEGFLKKWFPNIDY
jgi:hypothetical protein